MEHGSTATPTNPSDLPVGVNVFTVNFLRMVAGLWAKDFPDEMIQGIKKDQALAMAGDLTGKCYGSGEFAEAFKDLTQLRQALNAARAAHGIGASR